MKKSSYDIDLILEFLEPHGTETNKEHLDRLEKSRALQRNKIRTLQQDTSRNTEKEIAKRQFISEMLHNRIQQLINNI